MMYVLDTNVLSELRKVRLGKADANVAAWAEGVDAADLLGNGVRHDIVEGRGKGNGVHPMHHVGMS